MFAKLATLRKCTVAANCLTSKHTTDCTDSLRSSCDVAAVAAQGTESELCAVGQLLTTPALALASIICPMLAPLESHTNVGGSTSARGTLCRAARS